MSRSGSGRVTRAGGFAVFVVGLLAMVAALLAATPAWASSASNVSVRFRNPDQAPALVGAQTGYTVQLTSTSALLGGTQAGDHIALSVPAGTKFPTGSAVNSPYRLSTPRVGYNVNAAAIVSDVGATARIPLTGNASIEIRASDAVRLTVGIFENNVTNPTAAGSYRLGVATSRDTTPANSSPYTIGPNDPARVSAVAGASFARVGTGFLPLEAKVTDAHGNAVPSQGVTFAAPESGPSGTFASTGSATDAATTGVDGVATASAFTANTIAGAYQVRASSGDLEPADLPATTTPGPAENLAVDLEPRFVVADGRSTTTATATVTDEHGNGVPFEDVSFSSGGGQQIGQVTDNRDGTYEAPITSTATPGESTITATDNSVSPSVSGTATLTQDAAAPRVTATTPGGRGAGRGAPVTATFSEAMDAATIDGSTFRFYRVTRSGAKRLPHAQVALSADGLVATLDPFGASATLLAKDSRYRAVVTTGAGDLAGNGLDQSPSKRGSQQKSWTFTTGKR